MNNEPLPISVELASDIYDDDRIGQEVMLSVADIAEIIDVRVRPLVEALRECRRLTQDGLGDMHADKMLAKIDAALKAAGDA